MSQIARSLALLNGARFFTLASRSLDDSVWAATVNFVPAYSPVKMIWCSMRSARHSENIRQHPQVSGSVFRTDLQGESPLGLDGAQFTGVSRELSEHENAATHDYFSCCNFPDEALRDEWMPPLSEFMGEGKRRFYELTITEWWLLDIERWLETRQDQRIAVNLDGLINVFE
ncbi:pyridoxamine 5'-phosphate oxidase family protein [Serratia fonticola]|uniref:pyridoxamine 5'-phosphate oxidase family protein n=1 Tax=Serratia fonticola TaxID=47917 RepID=UPI0015759092|nr:pyridoxamine 5'-phosphate oxidase family protein [Serratia fonticola]NTY86600.1 pyridoxamine 5'-phosphate oxidase family protein [Serratia fonticola]NTZ12678.1 pyridoxamine 5'-phosphate oxidase family protein [Serratia fonticola]